ncbi:MAG TPA: protein phosphatase 2C domain-containing protein [Candidatus Saccharimonadales bacterium]|nr:protein phosphatase 2C domain-containing protein [Candidatus Saccharimonadales bacterium]
MTREQFPYAVEFGGASHIGYTHADAGAPNEDYFGYRNRPDERYAVGVVADGLGRLPGGYDTSHAAGRNFIHAVNNLARESDSPEEVVRGAMEHAHYAVAYKKTHEGLHEDGATTFMGFVFDKAEGGLLIPHSGDSFAVQAHPRTGVWHELTEGDPGNGFSEMSTAIDGRGTKPEYALRRVKASAFAGKQTLRFVLGSDGHEDIVWRDDLGGKDDVRRVRAASTAMHKTPQQAARESVHINGIYDNRRAELLWWDDTTSLIADVHKR